MATPTAQEQYMLELVNRARANPNAEAQRQGIDLNQGLANGTLDGSAKQALVFNFDLIDSSRSHSQWMLDQDQFSHTGAGGSSAGDRMRQANYDFTGNWTWGENIAYQGSTGNINPTTTIAAEHNSLFKSSGHRTNILSDNFREIGIGAIEGEYNGYNALMTTQNFARSGNDVFLTGVAFDDAVTDDDFYTVGEGLGGITVTATNTTTNQTFTTQTYSSGGYQLALDAGTYEVDFSGNNLGDVAEQTITIGNRNVKIDLATDQLPAPAPSPEPETTPPAEPVEDTEPSQPEDSMEETPADETPVEDAPVNETPMEETPVDEAPAEDAPVNETPTEDTPVDETPVEDAPVNETPTEETPVDETPVEDAPVNETPTEETPADEAPVEDAPVNEIPMEDSPTAGDTPEPAEPMEESGNNLIEGTNGRDRLRGTTADDELQGMEGSDRLFGRAGNDLLMGGKGNDRLNGGRGSDTLVGADATTGGVGEIDILHGGAGSDLFVLGDANQAYYNDGQDGNWGTGDFAFIRDFNASQGDTLQLNGEASDYNLYSMGSCGDALFHGDNELIAVIKTRGNEALALDSSAVEFV